MENTEFMNKEYNMHLDFSVSLGPAYTKWMQALADKKILANKCPKCGNHFVPAKPFCEKCFEEPTEWIETDGEGIVESFTIGYVKFRNFPEPPYVIGVIRIGGSAVSMIHWIAGFDYDNPEDIPNKIQLNMKVRPVWADERKGDLLDIKYFEPV
ncbi:MAG: Zn-ribbon domain-containing OB-fold protein [Thermodesulfobacteriota bacterium]|nr:Zn-ribbon domain-containing OB-fold protein [Thermodesulfobacteriota bacterium]